MAADFASSRVFPDPLSYKLRVDCEREIDFDFFDDAPSAPTTPSWRGPAGPQRDSRTTLADSDADGVPDEDDGNAPSPTLVGGPTPVDGRSALSSSVSLASSVKEDGKRLSVVEDVVEDASEDVAEVDKDGSEVPGEHADDDVVVARVAGRGSTHHGVRVEAGAGAGHDAPRPAAPAAPLPQAQRNSAPASGTLEGRAADSDESDAVLEVDEDVPDAVDSGDGADPPQSSTLVTEASQPPSRSATPSPSSFEEDSDDSDGGAEDAAAEVAAEDAADDAAEDADEDAAEPEEVAFGIQELSLTVSHKPHRAASSVTVSSLTVSSMTAVSGMSRTDSAGDSDPEDAYTMEAIKKALRRARPPSSTGSLPVMAPSSSSRPGRSRRLNMSFSNDDARRIQRDNELLLRRIVGQRGRQPLFGPPPATTAAMAGMALGRMSPAPPPPHRCSHAVNRARRGKDIERDNQILLKKIQSAKRSPSQLSMSSRSSSAMSGRYSYC